MLIYLWLFRHRQPKYLFFDKNNNFRRRFWVYIHHRCGFDVNADFA